MLVFHGTLPLLLSLRHADIPDEDAYRSLAINLATRGSFSVDFPVYWHEPGQPFTHLLGINLYQFSGSDVFDPYDPWAEVDWDLPPGVEKMSPKERNSALLAEALRGIVSRPGHYLRQCLRRAYYLFSPVPNFYAVSPLRYWAVGAASVLFFHSFLLLVVLRLVRLPQLRQGQWLLLTALVVW